MWMRKEWMESQCCRHCKPYLAGHCSIRGDNLCFLLHLRNVIVQYASEVQTRALRSIYWFLYCICIHVYRVWKLHHGPLKGALLSSLKNKFLSKKHNWVIFFLAFSFTDREQNEEFNFNTCPWIQHCQYMPQMKHWATQCSSEKLPCSFLWLGVKEKAAVRMNWKLNLQRYEWRNLFTDIVKKRKIKKLLKHQQMYWW